MFISNKYYKWYMNLIEGVQQVNRSKKDGDFDCHHILPRSMGGTNVKTNLVYLTHREHFMAHVLLVKCVEKPFIYKMVSALVRFKHKAVSSRSYALYKETISKYSKGEYNSAYGKIWCHNIKTLDIMFVHKTEFDKMDPEVYAKGLPYQRGGYRDRIWVNKDGKRAAIVESELEHYLDNGWVRGREVDLGHSHYVKMTKNRHTKEKDNEHSKKLSGRVAVKDKLGNVKRVSQDKLNEYLQNGYQLFKGSGVKMNTAGGRSCLINGQQYDSVAVAAKKLDIKYNVVMRRIKNDKWTDWNYVI